MPNEFLVLSFALNGSSLVSPSYRECVEELRELVLSKICVQHYLPLYDFSVTRVYGLDCGGKIWGPNRSKGLFPVAKKEEREKLCAEDAPGPLFVKTFNDLLEGEEVWRFFNQRGKDSIRRPL